MKGLLTLKELKTEKIIELIDLKEFNSLIAIGIYTIYTCIFKCCEINDNEVYQTELLECRAG